MTFSPSPRPGTLSGTFAETTVRPAPDGDAFRAALARLAATYPGTEALIAGFDMTGGPGSFLITNHSDPALRRAFAEELARPGDWVTMLRRIEPGRVYDDTDCAPSGDATPGPLAEVYRHARPAMRCYSGIAFDRGDGLRIAIELRYPGRLEHSLRRDLRDSLPEACDRLDAAMQVLSARRRLVEAETLTDNLLNMMPFPVLLCDETRQVSGMNQQARSLVGGGRTVEISPDGVLHLTDPALDSALSDALAGLSQTLRHRVTMLASGPGGSDAGGAAAGLSSRAVVAVLRLSAAGFGKIDNIRAGPQFAVLIEDLAAPLDLDQNLLWRVFGMNAKESDLALGLLAGRSIASLAVERRMSKETLRNQLAAVMRKTDTTRQQDLVALLTRLAAFNATT